MTIDLTSALKKITITKKDLSMSKFYPAVLLLFCVMDMAVVRKQAGYWQLIKPEEILYGRPNQ